MHRRNTEIVIYNAPSRIDPKRDTGKMWVYLRVKIKRSRRALWCCVDRSR